MIRIRFYTFSKKENSTARPSASFVEFSCLIKSGSGIVNPRIELATSANVSRWNYAYIPDYTRYYFIREWTYDNGQWIASLDCDVLASWKDYIGSSNQFIARCSATYDGDIIDNYYPNQTESHVESYTFPGNPVDTDMRTSTIPGNFLVGIINNDSAYSVGAVSYYSMTPDMLGQMKSLLMTDNGWIGNVDSGASTVEISQSKVQINPFQYIASCRWFPVQVGSDPLPTTNIRCGWWNAGISGYKYRGRYEVHRTWTITTPKHPQASARGSWLNNKQNSSYILDFLGFHFVLDANMVAQTSSIQVSLYVDFIGGQGDCKVLGIKSDGTSFLLAEQCQTICVSIPMAQISYSSEGLGNVPVIGALTSLGSSIGISAAGAIAGDHNNSFTSNIRSIGTALGFNQITSSFTAGSGGLASIQAHPIPMLTCVFQYVSDEDDNHSVGRPLCKNRTISGIPGFIMCEHVEIPLPSTAAEQGSVKSLMEGGFFYE